MPQRGLEYVGRSQRDLRDFPAQVQEIVAFALLEAQAGGKHPDAKPLAGFGGASVLELALAFDTNAYRVVYTLKFPEMVYVLHAFMKKSKQGISMANRDKEMIERRLQAAADLHAGRDPRS